MQLAFDWGDVEPSPADVAPTLPPMTPRSDDAIAAQKRQALACHETEVQRYGVHPGDTTPTE